MDINEMMKKAKELQENLQKAQEDLSKVEYEGVAGGGLVKCLMKGNYSISDISIDASLLPESTSEKKEKNDVLQSLIKAAINNALDKLKLATQEQMKTATGGLDLGALTGKK